MIKDSSKSIFWFRRDLRLEDNHGLYQALKREDNVQAIFIFDVNILDKLNDTRDKRVLFIYYTLKTLKEQLEEKGSTLKVFFGDPIDFFEQAEVKSVYTNHDYEPYARDRDKKVEKALSSRNIPFYTFKDQVVFEKEEVVKDDGTPYVVFTPYSKKWKGRLRDENMKDYPTLSHMDHFHQCAPSEMPTLDSMGFEKGDVEFPERVIKQSIIKEYDEQRDYPAVQGTTRLSVHLRFGTVSIRKLAKIGLEKNEVWLNELIWRDFYAMILWHFPKVENNAFRAKYDKISWRNNTDEFQAWCEGRTGYPIVDAGMRELNETGFMHNRVRMVVASFLTKHLLIDWRWGEAYFAEKLLDYDLASNNGGWQWAAGSGCDAAPYFRVFNPYSQTEKFDKEKKYIKKWVPEFESDDYPAPIIEHKPARERALDTYKKALNNA